MRRFSLSPFRFLILAGVLAIAGYASQSAWAQGTAGAQPAAAPKHSINPFGIVVQNLDFVFFIICLCSIIGVTLIIQGFIKARATVMMPEESTNHIRELISQRQFKELIEYTETDPSFISKALNPALKRAPSFAAMKEAIGWIHQGHLGKIKIARGLCYKRRESIGNVPAPQPIPPNIDYDLWCGPALKLPLMRKKLHYDWHWVWNTGCGDIGNQGIHEMDKSRWALGRVELAPKVFSIGGRLGYLDNGETANTQMVLFDYGEALLIFEVRGLPLQSGSASMDRYRGENVGQVIECEGGYLSGTTAYDQHHKVIQKFNAKGEDHFANFIRAVRSRKREDLNADILEGHLSSALCHLGNISYRLGKQADPDELHAALKKDDAASETLTRMEEHLAANGVDLKQTNLTIGPTLNFDPETERFIDNDQANKMLTRAYRAPFVVPEKL